MEKGKIYRAIEKDVNRLIKKYGEELVYKYMFRCLTIT